MTHEAMPAVTNLLIDPNITERPPPFELFSAPLEIALSPNDYENVIAAYTASKFGHYGQERDGGTRFFDHPKAAAWIAISELRCFDPRLLIGILLHDIREKSTLLSLRRISLNFGEECAFDVRALTKLPNGKETLREYVERVIERGPWAMAAKLCDLLHNLRTLGACEEVKRQRKIAETEEYYIPRMPIALAACGGTWTGYADNLGNKIATIVTAHTKNL